MTLDEFVAVLVDFHGDLDLMVRGHPFSLEEVSDAFDLAENEAEQIILAKMVEAASQ